MRCYFPPTVWALSMCFLFSGAVAVQTNAKNRLKARAESVAAACKDDFKNHCADVTAGEASIVFCANEDKISDNRPPLAHRRRSNTDDPWGGIPFNPDEFWDWLHRNAQ
jgi:hypothetical protein